jgi:rhodanese-related sulfurtransferase
VQALVDAREMAIVQFCAAGGWSAMAAVTMKVMGFKEVYSLAGGIARWAVEKGPVTWGQRTV